MRCSWAVALFLSLSGLALAQQPSLRKVSVNLSLPSNLSYRVVGQPPVQLGSFEAGSARIEIPNGDLDVRANGSSLLNEWHGVAHFDHILTTADLVLEEGPNYETVAGIVSALLMAGLALKLVKQRRLTHHIREQSQLRADLAEPLNRSDGNSPRG